MGLECVQQRLEFEPIYGTVEPSFSERKNNQPNESTFRSLIPNTSRKHFLDSSLEAENEEETNTYS
jgi:hypothetical protein